jgi:hypothetical protein
MTKLMSTDRLDVMKTAYEQRWNRGADAIFSGLKSRGCSTVADVAAMNSTRLLLTDHVGPRAFPRILILLDENEIEHNLRTGLSPAIEQRWKKNVLGDQSIEI